MTGTKANSVSEEIANRLATFVKDNRLDNPYGGTVTKHAPEGKKAYWLIPFSKPRSVDGEIRVYNRNFMLVRYRTGYLQLPRDGFHNFKAEQTVIEFLSAAFIDLDFDLAQSLIKE